MIESSWPKVLALLLPMSLALGAVAFGEQGAGQWQLVFAEDFESDSWRPDWVLDGLAELSTVDEGDARFLRIKTLADPKTKNKGASVLWLRREFQGELRFEFRIRAEQGNRSLFYFNARPTTPTTSPLAQAGVRASLFDTPRPDADMSQYAGTGLMELYSIGILRDDQKECNLRYLGGPEMSRLFTNQRKVFETASVMASFDGPFADKPPNTWYECRAGIVGPRITFAVDGVPLLDCLDRGTTDGVDFRWTPLTGGCLAFRNFQPCSMCLDYLRVYRRVAPKP